MSELNIKSALLKLKSSDPNVNMKAVEDILDMVNKDPKSIKPAIPQLIQNMRKKDARIVIISIEAIGKIGSIDPSLVKFAVPQLLKKLEDDNKEIYCKAFEALTEISVRNSESVKRGSSRILSIVASAPVKMKCASKLLGIIFPEAKEDLDRMSDLGNNAILTAVDALSKGDMRALGSITGGEAEPKPAKSEKKEDIPVVEMEPEPVAPPEPMPAPEIPETAPGEAALEVAVETPTGTKGISEEAFEKMAETLLEKARKAYEEGDYDAVEKYTQEIEELAQQSKEAIYIKELKNTIESARTSIQWAENSGLDTTMAKKMLAQAEKALEEKYYEDAMRAAKQAIQLTQNAKATSQMGVQTSGGQPSSAPSVQSYGQPLNPVFTLNNFIVGNSNRFAHAAAVAVSERPGQTYNPLFIYSGPGLGKTHLIQSIGHSIIQKMPHMKVTYITTEKFIHDLMAALETGSLDNFRASMRNIDVLLVDDIQFLSGQEATQEEFYHIFNEMTNAKKQIVLTSDRPPADIERLEKRLLTRFEIGLITDIQPPSLEMRTIILERTAQEENTKVPQDVITYIAEQIKSNIRTLKGAMKQVIAYSSLTGKPIDVGLAEGVLKSMGEVQMEKKAQQKIPAADRVASPAEEDVVVMQPIEVEVGHSYLVEEDKPRFVFEILEEKLKQNYSGLCITRSNPQQLLKKYDIGKAKMFWLTDRKVDGADTIRPSLERMISTLENFMEEDDKGILLLDGIEYLISISRFDPVLKFIRELVDVNSLTETIFMVPINQTAISTQEISMLEREMETIKL